MKFIEKIIEPIESLLSKYNFFLKEKRKNFIEFESDFLSLSISYNEFEISLYIFISRINSIYGIEIDNELVKVIFKSDLVLKNKSLESYIDYLVNLMQNDLFKQLLLNDLPILENIEVFNKERSKIYTNNLILRQNINNVDRLWNSGNYKFFIDEIDKISFNNLPASYKLKYNIALKKIKIN